MTSVERPLLGRPPLDREDQRHVLRRVAQRIVRPGRLGQTAQIERLAQLIDMHLTREGYRLTKEER